MSVDVRPAAVEQESEPLVSLHSAATMLTWLPYYCQAQRRQREERRVVGMCRDLWHTEHV